MDQPHKKNHALSRFNTWVLDKVVPGSDFFTLQGDFKEMFSEIARKNGRGRANVWFFMQILKSLPKFLKKSLQWSFIMFKNYLKIALRNIVRQKAYSFLNISGLAIGIACCILIILFVQSELSYDTFHPNADRIYRITSSTSGDNIATNANGIWATGPALKRDFREVVDFVRIRRIGQDTKTFIGYENRKFYETKFFFADPNLFTFFNFPLVAGDPDNALVEPNTIVLTEETAKKYFGSENPLGRTLTADPYSDGRLVDFRVTGIAKNVPPNSHLKFNVLASYVSQREKGSFGNFSGFEGNYTYVLLEENASAEELNGKLLDFLHRNWRQDPWYTNQLQPLTDIHLYSHIKSELEANGNIIYVYTFSAIAVFILLIACINFMNLATARSVKRAKEVGLRKVVGAQRKQLIRQFLGESMILSIIGGVFSIALVYMLLPFFGTLSEREIVMDFFQNPVLAVGFVSIIIIVGLVSGSYPALFLSNFRPSSTIKGNAGSLTGARIRKGLVVFQFAISIAMISSTIIVGDQMNYVKTKNLGYDREQIMVIPLNNEMRANYEAIKSELLQNPKIINTATSSLVPTKGSNHSGFKVEGVEGGLSLARYYVDKDFLDTYGVRFIAGEDVEKGLLDERGGDFVISELAVMEAGWSSPSEALGKVVTFNNYKGTISGVVNDLYIYSLRQELYSTIFFITPLQFHKFMSVKLDTDNLSETITYIDEIWKKFSPNFPLDYFFMDESFAEMHRADQKLSEVFTYFSSLAIIVACLGLFGLAAFTAEQRTKEIGVRKVLGASMSRLITLVIKDFAVLVLVSNLLAWPIAYFFMNGWLQGFLYRIDIGIHTFIISAAAAFFIAVVTVCYQSLKVVIANPIKSLRYE